MRVKRQGSREKEEQGRVKRDRKVGRRERIEKVERVREGKKGQGST